ncbi:hypothetical protein PbJCM13498_18480 [Prolixibacter bellariivorans]|uniref:Carrier domain-containing protein n=1 Tax=Prolixibacter bellariivorans TaxID=314319 RepID=A0A5M4AYK7_9BACT|nr:hypothetical protein [Prolixibacter bellariivorans]GET32985.1 hypothetical protein PbJCM13498_18480 [Prolixibacter bellariivorans]
MTTKVKLYRILRRVGLQKKRILIANNKEELFLDELDNRLLTYYFEKEFGVTVEDEKIPTLTTVPMVERFLARLRKSA